MKKLLCMVLMLALCLPLCAVAEDAAPTEIDLSGKWYSVLSTLVIKDELSEKPESVDDLPADYVSTFELDGCSLVQLSDDVILCYVLEDGVIANVGLVRYNTGAGVWRCLSAQTNEFLSRDGVIEPDVVENADDGVKIRVWDMVQEYEVPITVLNENAFTYATSDGIMTFMYVNVRKDWLDVLATE